MESPITGFSPIPSTLEVAKFNFQNALASTTNCHFDNSATPSITEATLERLIAWMIHDSTVNEEEVFASFLMCYRSFTNPYEVHAAMVLCYDQSFSYSDKALSRTVKMRISSFYLTWLGHFWWDVRIECPELGLRIQQLLGRLKDDSDLSSTFDERCLERCHLILNGPEQNLLRYAFVKINPAVQAPKIPSRADWTLKHLSPSEFARQLALMSFDAFLDTSLGEYCVPPKWIGPNRERLCPRLVQRIDLFNLISDFGSAYVLSGETPTKRAKNLDFLIKTAKKLSELRCFDPLYALISGCQRSEILRLSKTRDALSSGSLATLDELASLFDSTQNYAKLDAEQSKGKCLPYLGMFLKKLAFMSGDAVHGLRPGWCNVKLMLRTGSELLFATSAYDHYHLPFARVAILQDFIQTCPRLSLDEMRELSLYHEPKATTPATTAVPNKLHEIVTYFSNTIDPGKRKNEK